MTLAKDIARDLLKIEAVYLKPEEPFTWASGIKSPIYTDNRVVVPFWMLLQQRSEKVQTSLE